MKKIPLLITAILFSLALVSCSSRTYEEAMKVPEEKFYKGQYLEAAKLLLPDVNNAGKDQLLFMMECGLMLHSGEDYEKSNKVLLPAAKLAKLIPISVTDQISSFLTSDVNSDYRGEDHEKVLVHMYLGLNFLMLEKYDEARVEFLAVNNELTKIRSEDGSPRYKQNVMAKYLTAIAFEINGELNRDDKDIEYAYTELKQVYALKPDLAMVKDDLLRLSKRLGYDDDYESWQAQFGKGYSAPETSGELVTIFQSGRGPIKKSRGSLLKDKDMGPVINVTLNTGNWAAGVTVAAILVTLQTAENPIPKFVKRSNKVNRIKVEANGKAINTVMLEDVEQTAIQNLEDDYGRLYKRVAISIATKAAAAVIAGVAAKAAAEQVKDLGPFASLIGTAVGAATGAALFAQMRPDLRSWHTLPANFQLGRFNLKPGKHKVRYVLIGAGGIVDTVEKEVEIKKGGKTLFNIRTLF